MSSSKKFWNKEYATSEHFDLSDRPAQDLEKFLRFIDRRRYSGVADSTSFVLDLGCGNGRNLIALAREYYVHGVGYDISEEAIAQAEKAREGLDISFEVRSISGEFPLKDNSVDCVLDMAASHYLNVRERDFLRSEILRVLRPGGFVLFKSLLLDGDANAKQFLKKYPSDEEGSYIHPTIGVLEHVWTEKEVREFWGEDFIIHKLIKSYKHRMSGRPGKRRNIVAYLQKKESF
jgi:SAM-dependent methyltransferase